MNVPLRKGRCPGALRPMAARDGLLVRLRITGGILPSSKARAIADLAARHGNGLFDLSSRANLQMRGVMEDALPALWDGLSALDLLDDSGDAESVRNVIASPLAGLHDGLDIRPIVAALEARLVEDDALHALPTKFGFLVDDGSDPSLASVSADVRFDWDVDQQAFAIGLGGTCSSAVRLGYCGAEKLVEAAAEIARGAIGLFASTLGARRMHALIANVGQAKILASLPQNFVIASEAKQPRGNRSAPGLLRLRLALTAADIVGHHTFGGTPCIGLAAPFGRLRADMLHDAATLAETHGSGELRLTPWRTILVQRATTISAVPPAFITDPSDPRLAIDACVGQDGCERGTTATRDDATALADLGMPLHVSGCEKGCARPSSSPITLVGRDGRYDLVRDGRASDQPVLRDLSLAAARAAILSFRAHT